MRQHRRLAVSGFLAVWLSAAPTASQLQQVVAITPRAGFEIDADEREEYGLFAGYPGFVAARFLLDGDEYDLRITHVRGGLRLVEQLRLSARQFEAYRTQVEAVDAAILAGARRGTSTDAEREGRLRMVTDVFAYGLFLYGPGTILCLDIEGRAAMGVQLLVAGGTFAGALDATQDYRLGYGRGKLVRWGTYGGTFYGLGIPALFEADSERVYAASAMAVTPIGGYLAHRLSAHRPFGKGEADLIATGGVVGGLYGLAVPFLVGIDHLDDDDQVRVYLAASMAGVPAGAWTTTSLIRGRSINRGRAHLLTLGGVVGATYAASLVDMAGIDGGEHPRPYVWAAALGLPIGARIAYRWTGAEEYTLGRARLISVGTYAGALVGSGILLTVGVEEGRAMAAARVLGSAAGLWFTHGATQGWGEYVTRAGPRQPRSGPLVTLTSPAELLAAGLLARHGLPHDRAVPLELVRVRF